jgi:hypothetical protein
MRLNAVRLLLPIILTCLSPLVHASAGILSTRPVTTALQFDLAGSLLAAGSSQGSVTLYDFDDLITRWHVERADWTADCAELESTMEAATAKCCTPFVRPSPMLEPSAVAVIADTIAASEIDMSVAGTDQSRFSSDRVSHPRVALRQTVLPFRPVGMPDDFHLPAGDDPSDDDDEAGRSDNGPELDNDTDNTDNHGEIASRNHVVGVARAAKRPRLTLCEVPVAAAATAAIPTSVLPSPTATSGRAVSPFGISRGRQRPTCRIKELVTGGGEGFTFGIELLIEGCFFIVF